MTNTKEQLVSSFKELYLIEKKAYDFYSEKLLESLSDYEEKVIQEIRNDEERHMEIATKIIKIIEASTI